MSDLIHSLLYWNYGGKHILSKTKLFSIMLFLIVFLSFFTSGLPGVILVGALFAGIEFCIGCIIHMLLPKPSKAVLDNSDNGLLTDLKHFFFYWQDRKTGQFTLSKTKILSVGIMVMSMLFSLTIFPFSVVGNVFFGIIVSFPAFLIGTGVHKTTVVSDKIQSHIPKQVPTPPPKIEEEEVNFDEYQIELNRLENEYFTKEQKLRLLIEKKFEPPQMTYNKFMAVLDNSTKTFTEEMDLAQRMMNLSDKKLLESKITNMKNIISKLDDLSDELVLSISNSKEDDSEVNDLLNDMEKLIKSVKDYD